jgi:hypothetical protein
MQLFGDQVDDRKGMLLGGETLGESVGRENGEPSGSMSRARARASQSLLARLIKLHMGGYSPEEIAVQVLTTDPENFVFRAALLVEIILHYARRGTKERTL